MSLLTKFKTQDLRSQLTLALSVGIIAMALATSVTLSVLASRTERGNLVSQGERLAENLARQSTLALLYGSGENAKDQINTTLAFPSVVAVGVFDTHGRPLIQHGAKRFVDAPVPASVPGHVGLWRETDADWQFVAPVYSLGRAAQRSGSPFEVSTPDTKRIGFVRLVLSKAQLHAAVRNIFVVNVAASLVLALILLLVMRYITGLLGRPLRNLSAIMKRSEKGASGLRAPPGGPREVNEMGNAFNKMMEVLEEREHQLTRARDAAIEMARVKSEFAANVSHELRTPLNGILGMLDLLGHQEMPGKQAEYLTVARNSANRLLALINDILDFSRLDAGKLDLEERDFDLREVLEQLLDLLAGPAQKKGLDLGYLIEDGVPPGLHGRVIGLEQILTNLVGNAIKFTDRGEVAVVVGPVADHGQSVELEFRVMDTGIGIDEAARTRIFEAFSQADRSTTRRFGGTGLGLAITRRLVTELGGSIEVDSEPGQGSTFRVRLTLNKASQPALPISQGHLPQGFRVLVVHRFSITRRFLETCLDRWEARYELASSGVKALNILRDAAARSIPYNAVLLDDRLPDMAAPEFAHRVKADPDTAGVTVILVTESRGAAVDSLRLRVGISDYVMRPVRMMRLWEALTEGRDAGTELLTPSEGRAGEHREAELAAVFSSRVLVVEDNLTNQQVAVGMLESLGCAPDVAADGVEAVAMHARRPYDLIFMDCNMPRLDGYEATARIRAAEPADRHVAIIALTANALEGDGERCLEAGMDDYIAKPLALGVLRERLQRWLKSWSSAVGVRELAPPERGLRTDDDDGEPVLDYRILTEVKGAMGEAIADMVEVFLEDTSTNIAGLQQALGEGDGARLQALAHELKGSCRNLGVHAMGQTARELETAAREGDLVGAQQLVERLPRQLEHAGPVLRKEIADSGLFPAAVAAEDAPLVLIVDDDRSARFALRYILERDGYRIAEAANGEEALRTCERTPPELVLMDAMMPEMDGFEACREIRRISAVSHIPVLMITALDDQNSAERAFAAGASDFIPKPVHYSVLRQRLSRLVHASRSERRIKQLALHDPLTGLANRRLFHEQLEQAIGRAERREQKLAVALLDLDRFKHVNESLDHRVGDLLLQAVADRIRGCLRSADLVARLGGDEFAVLLHGSISEEVATTVANKIHSVLVRPFVIQAHEIFVSASMGITLYPDHGVTADDLLKRADSAMYGAKDHGNDFRFYDPSLEEAISRRMALEHDIRRALENQDFLVYYQPVLELTGNTVVGAEALIRWRHPERGIVSPGEFIELAESTGLVLPLGEWVLRAACAQFTAWQLAELEPGRISVNLSGRQLQQRDFVDMVARILNQTNLEARHLTLEITETVLLRDPDSTLEILRELRAMGVQLSVDDFGTGYSSLSYLKDLPIDVIKIDRSFVQDICTNRYDAAMLRGIVELAHGLGLKVVAEGVERTAQREFLAQHRCDMIQGFVLSEPLSGPVYEQRVLRRREALPGDDADVVPISRRRGDEG